MRVALPLSLRPRFLRLVGVLVGGGQLLLARALGVAELLAAFLGQLMLVLLAGFGDALLEFADALAHAARELRQARAAEEQEDDEEDDEYFPAAEVHLESSLKTADPSVAFIKP